MTQINRRNCLKVFAGSVLGLPAALPVAADDRNEKPANPAKYPSHRPIYVPTDGPGLMEVLSRAFPGDRIELVGKSYDCSGRQLVIPSGVSVFRDASYPRSVIRCLGVTDGRDSKLSNVCIIYNSRRES